MNRVSDGDLNPCRDPAELLETLGLVEDDQRAELQQAVATLLDHSDADIRQQALRIMAFRWSVQESRGFALREIADPASDELRVTGIYALAHLSGVETRPNDIRLLLKLVFDNAERKDVRRSVYESLLALHPPRAMPPLNRDFDVDLMADWKWLRFLSAEPADN